MAGKGLSRFCDEPKNVCGRARRNSSLRGNVSRIQLWGIILLSKQEFKQHFSVQRVRTRFKRSCTEDNCFQLRLRKARWSRMSTACNASAVVGTRSLKFVDFRAQAENTRRKIPGGRSLKGLFSLLF